MTPHRIAPLAVSSLFNISVIERIREKQRAAGHFLPHNLCLLIGFPFLSSVSLFLLPNIFATRPNATFRIGKLGYNFVHFITYIGDTVCPWLKQMSPISSEKRRQLYSRHWLLLFSLKITAFLYLDWPNLIICQNKLWFIGLYKISK